MNLWQVETSIVPTFLSAGVGVFLFGLVSSQIPSQIRLLKKYGTRLKKSLGQHILIDPNIARKIIQEVNVSSDDGIIEIGAGLGALTLRLLPLARRVVAVEIDAQLVDALRAETNGSSNLTIIEGDFLKLDLHEIVAGYRDVKRWKIVGNLPYYITTNILLRLIEARSCFKTAVITVQEDFARRLVALPGSKDYSSLSIFVQTRFEVRVLFTIKQGSFFPRPEVRSAVVRMDVLERPPYNIEDEGLFFQTVRAAFGQRRKTLRRSLRNVPKLDPELIDEVSRTSGVGLDKRGEELSIGDFARLANAIKRVLG